MNINTKALVEFRLVGTNKSRVRPTRKSGGRTLNIKELDTYRRI